MGASDIYAPSNTPLSISYTNGMDSIYTENDPVGGGTKKARLAPRDFSDWTVYGRASISARVNVREMM